MTAIFRTSTKPFPDIHCRLCRHPFQYWVLLWFLGTALGDGGIPEVSTTAKRIPWQSIGALSPVTLILPPVPACIAFVGVTLMAAALRETIVRHPTGEVTFATAPDRWSPAHVHLQETEACLRITSWPILGREESWRGAAILQTAASPGLRGERVLLRGRGTAPRIGDTCRASLILSSAPGPTAPDGFSMRRFLRGRCIRWQAKVENLSACGFPGYSGHVIRCLIRIRQILLQSLSALYPRRESLLLSSVLLGERENGLREVKSPFTELGLGHLFAVSGLHVGLIAGILAVCLKPLTTGPITRWCLMSAGLGLYVLLSGMAFSTVRATLLVLGALSGNVLGLSIDSLRMLAFLFWGSIVWSPDMIVDTGFRLSYLAAGGIVLGLRLITPWVESLNKPLKWLAISLAVSMAAQWATLPEVAAAFGWLNIFAPLYNLLVVPVFGAGITLAVSSLICLPMPWLAQSLAAIAWCLLRLLEIAAVLGERSTLILGLPAWRPSELGLYLTATGLFIAGLRPVGRRRRVCLLLAFACSGYLVFGGVGGCPVHKMRVWQFDVGQGDCALMIFPDGSKVMIDTGDCWRGGGSPFDLSVAPWLRRRGISELDGLILTHHHSDHDGALGKVFSHLKVKEIWYNGSALYSGEFGGLQRIPYPGQVLHRSGEWLLRCIYAPEPNSCNDNENNRSLVVALEHAGRKAGLWMGDLESEGEAELPLPGSWSVDVLKAGHHGSRTSSSRKFLDNIRPGLVILSCGVDNRHQHPSHGVFTLDGDTLQILRTDLDGCIGMSWHLKGRFLGFHTTRGN